MMLHNAPTSYVGLEGQLYVLLVSYFYSFTYCKPSGALLPFSRQGGLSGFLSQNSDIFFNTSLYPLFGLTSPLLRVKVPIGVKGHYHS